MLDRLGIRGKVLAVVAVPILVLILAAVFIVAQSAQSLTAAQDEDRVLGVLTSIQDVQDDFQDERWYSTNFAHSVQDGQSKLSAAYGQTDSALEDIQAQLDSLAEDPDVTAEGPSVEEIQSELDAAIKRAGAGVYLADERSVTIGAPTEETGGWITFPDEGAIAQMQAGYEESAAAVDALADSLPDEYDLDVPLAALAFRVGNESTLATALFTEPQQYIQPLQQAQAAVETSVEQLGVDSSLLQVNAENEQAIAVLAEAEEALADLPQIRMSVMNTTGNVPFLTNYYSAVIDATVRSTNVVGVTMGNPDVVSGLQAFADLDLLIESMLFEETVTQRLIRAGTFLPGEEAQVRTMTTRTDIALEVSQESSSSIDGAPEVPGYGASAGDVDGTSDSFQSVRTQVLTGLDSSLVGLRDAEWPAQVDAEVAVYDDLRSNMWTTVEEASSSARTSAVWQTVLTAIAAIVIVALSLIVALLIARRIVGPMRRLTTTATAVRTELPRLVERVAVPGEDVDVSEVQIPVESQDEVGRLAEAFNSVNATTLSIAAEQAALRGSISEMFVNVARRDQVLLNRQLASIDDMERTEDDPDTLTKLFALDHLATRMRRNSESLLVLAGIDTGRRLRRPMPLSDVIRTASSEIELYERVELDLREDPAMLGHAALSTAHLIAELLENATVFSDPGTPVTVRTSRHEDSYTVEVIDQGIGMTESELADANGRVGSTAASEILGAQRLGLFVVGRIARRVGAAVSIASREGEGTVATVVLPTSLFASEGQSTDSLPPAAMPSEGAAPAQSQPTAPPASTQAPAALAGAAYAPAAVEEGAPLGGRGGEALPSRGGEPAAAPAGAQSDAPGDSIDDLIAADAAAAPQAEPANIEDLTEGSTSSGLPTRRRRSASGAADEEREQKSVVGLPARATEAQLSALAAEADDSFSPAVPASEIAPQSVEERASMFRGFRSRRETEQEVTSASPLPSRRSRSESADSVAVPQLEGDQPLDSAADAAGASSPPASPSLGTDDDNAAWGGAAAAGAATAGAAAFGAAAFFGSRDRDAKGTAAAEPNPDALGAPQPDAEPENNAPVEAASEPAEEPQPRYELEPDSDAGVAGFRMPKFDAATTGQIPVVRDEEPAEQPADSVAEPVEAVTDANDPDTFEAPADDYVAAATPEPTIEPDPEPAITPVWARTEEETEGAAAAFAVPELEDDEDADSAEQAASEYASPSFDDAAFGDAPVHSESVAPSAQSAPWPPTAASAAWAQVNDSADNDRTTDENQAPEFAGADTAQDAGNQPAPEQATPWAPTPPPAAASAAPVAPASADSPQLDALIQSAVEDDHQPGFFSRLFGRGKSGNSKPTPQVEESPRTAAPSFTPQGGFAPVDQPVQDGTETNDAPGQEQDQREPQRASFLPPTDARTQDEQTPAPSAPSAGWAPNAPQQPAAEPSQPAPFASSFKPQAEEAPAAPSAPQSFEPGPAPFSPAPQQPAESWPTTTPDPDDARTKTQFTPDDLARATGWEAAGESALQATEPDTSGGYQPIIQPEPLADDEPDMTSAVFSELSSLAAERPKVEKTRAGLQKRRPSNAAPVEVKPLEEEPTPQGEAPERDADAVRERFSSFYSGTQRARSDVKAMDNDAHSPHQGGSH